MNFKSISEREGVFQDGLVVAEERLKPRASRDREVTKIDILLAAMHEFAEYGDSGARIDRIAYRANANKSLIYQYFGNKEELYAQVIREAYAQIRRGERALNLDRLEPQEAIRRLLRFTMEHYLTSPWFLRLLATENLRRGKTIGKIPDIVELQSPLIDQLSDVLARGAAQGIFRDDVDAFELYTLVASFFYFPVSNAYTLSAVFKAPIENREWFKKRLVIAEGMILGYLEGRI